MSKPPAFQIYPRDFIADCAGMSNEAFGAFVRLTFHAWDPPCCADGTKPPVGHLPNDPDILAEKSEAGSRWEHIAGRVLRQFRTTDDGRFLVSKRLVEERKKQISYSNSMKENGKKGGRPRKPNESRTKAEENPRVFSAKADGKPGESRGEAEKTSASASASASASSSATSVAGDGKPSRKRNPRPKIEPPAMPFRAAHAMALVAAAAGDCFVVVHPLPAGYAIGVEAHVKAYPEEADWTNLGEYLASGRVHFDEPPGPSVLAGNYGAELLAKARAWSKAGKPAKNNAPPRFTPDPPPARHVPGVEETMKLLARLRVDDKGAS